MIKLFSRKRRTISIFLLLLFLFQLLESPVAYALTAGPSQPEVQSFQAATTSDMVDIFSGDFSYNIPLFELPGPNGGYPFNLAYQAGVGMDQESSWTGLGWNLNPGAISRQMRGLPDEFNGDTIYTKMSINPSVTVGLSAGVGFEFFGADKGSKKGKSGGTLNVGLSVSYNNFKGVGYSIDGSVGYAKTNDSGITRGVGLSASLDSKEGLSASPSLSLAGKLGTFGLGVGYNSQVGLSNLSLTHDRSKKNPYIRTSTDKKEKENTQSAVLTLAHPGYTPQISMPMQSTNISVTLKAGSGFSGVFASGYVTGFYNEQWLKNNRKRVGSFAYGYLHYQNASAPTAMLDINREKDGMITQESPNLAIPSLSYDIYSVAGQGISAMYRPMRNDYGIVHDPVTISASTGGGVGVDIGPPGHGGINLTVNHSKSVSGPWTGNNDLAGFTSFLDKSKNASYEPWYFKVHGEQSSDSLEALGDLGGDKAVRIKLTGRTGNFSATQTLENKTGSKSFPASKSSNRARKARSQVIQSITNEELLNGGLEVLPQFRVTYVDHTDVERVYERKRPAHHIAAFTATTPEGLRYNYGIPAYNVYQEDVTFTTDKKVGDISRVNIENNNDDVNDPKYNYRGTEKLLKKTEIPAYAHSHLLTSILGPDYVDVTGDGVTSEDLGYWVKFTYKKTTSEGDNYKWRDPFSKAHYQVGWTTDPRDDKGSFVYGEKEIWYLAKAETRSHIATFEILKRDDGRGVDSKLQNVDSTAKEVYKLREIKLFSRFGGGNVPIKKVRFEYDNSLCPGVFNNPLRDNADPLKRGKLTLKKVWFEYGGSRHGEFNPYIFTYHQNNPSYNILAYDRWGTYKPFSEDHPNANYDFPYSEQDSTKKAQIDANAAAWSLTEIKLPSGGKIMVDYESDDYAFVQHKQAMQMIEIVNPNGDPGVTDFEFNYTDTKVKFKLEAPINRTLTMAEQRLEVSKYLDTKRKQLFFKIKINLRSPSENFHEFISGYADINVQEDMGLEADDSGVYRYGYFQLVREQGINPFALRVFQHLRTNQPELANSGRKLKRAPLEQTGDNKKRISQIKSLGNIVAQVRKTFAGFNTFCKDEQWGREIIVGKSWIRLNSPDKIKYGGGLRVKQITIKDMWANNDEGVYGQVYTYTTEENGKTISSGVASYEPLTGGEENPLRYAKKYPQYVPLRTENNLFFEYPINETYYPGPSVGYSKVSVLSLASASLKGDEINHAVFPQGAGVSYGTSGMTVYEFFTARDFPVITDETEKANKAFKLPILIPFIGSISISKLATSQGYSIVTNDMHGKQKKVSNYRQNVSGQIEKEPISWVQYNYFGKERVYESEKVKELTNIFKDNGDGTLTRATDDDIADSPSSMRTIGQENEFFADMREYDDRAWSSGMRFNIDAAWVLPVPSGWPTIGKTNTMVRTAVTNKVIFKTGILESIEAFDGGSTVKTLNVKWDKLTGAPLLTQVKNNFDAPVYSYTIPAYTQYAGMGAAYQNIGLMFSVKNIEQDVFKKTLYAFTHSMAEENLFPGDELLLYAKGKTVLSTPVARVVFTGKENGDNILYSETKLTDFEYQAMIIRSGYRNQLSVSAGSITALEDPSTAGASVTHSKTLTIPK